MSYFKGKNGDKIRQFWHTDPANRRTLREWMAANGLREDISLTVFCRFQHYEKQRAGFLSYLKKANKKSKQT